jgi:hypothetical protein
MAPRKSINKTPVPDSAPGTPLSPRQTRSRARPSSFHSPFDHILTYLFLGRAPSPQRSATNPSRIATSKSPSSRGVSPERQASPTQKASPPRQKSVDRHINHSPKRAGRTPAKSPASFIRSLSSTNHIKSAGASVKPTASTTPLHWYYGTYIAIFCSAYAALAALLARSVLTETFSKLLHGAKPFSFSIFLQESSYRTILATLKQHHYLDAILQPFLVIYCLNALIETAHTYFDCNKRFKHRISSVGETYLPVLRAVLLYALFVAFPVKATSSHPLAFAILSALITERLIVFVHREAAFYLRAVPTILKRIR